MKSSDNILLNICYYAYIIYNSCIHFVLYQGRHTIKMHMNPISQVHIFCYELCIRMLTRYVFFFEQMY